MAVATLWLVRVGTAAEGDAPACPFAALDGALATARRVRRATRLRLVSLFRRGWVVLLVALLKHEPLPTGDFRPEPWPALPARHELPEPAAAELPHAA
jgi:hypothetical protein